MKTRSLLLSSAICIVLAVLAGCAPAEVAKKNERPPSWAKDAIWYQIFVERFHNGDHSNDPTKADITGGYPGFVPDDWQITPWTQDWYEADPYFENVKGRLASNGYPINNFDGMTSLRRYGGDLQGVIDKLDYLTSLGVNAIYFNPLNDSPSLHKFDARYWHHIDVNFGPDPEGDKRLIATENPADPSTWVMTSADKLFVDLLAQAKARDIRVIVDFSWNHTGNTFWAWQDVLENQQQSPYADWYWIERFDDPQTPENEFDYKGWFNVKQMPEIRETHKVDHSQRVSLFEGDIANSDAKRHILAVTQRWLDPNGDGDPADGVDGYRMDVAAEIPLGFWREYRNFVRSINPDAYLIGEIWWEEYPDDLMDPAQVLQGDVFDAVMNYRWYRSARRFFAGIDNQISASELVEQLTELQQGYEPAFGLAMMNMSASHDSPRLLTSFYNQNNYKFNARAVADERYKIGKPDELTYQRVKAFLAFQFTQPGAPQIWAGDEMGMWGSDDPNNRKPLIWPEFEFAAERGHPLGLPREPDPVAFDPELVDFYRSLIQLRKEHPVLIDGDIDYYEMDDEKKLLAYQRTNEQGHRVYVAFNMSFDTHPLQLPLGFMASTKIKLWQTDVPVAKTFVTQQPISMRPFSAAIVVIP